MQLPPFANNPQDSGCTDFRGEHSQGDRLCEGREGNPTPKVFSTKKKALRKQRLLEKQKANDQPLQPPLSKSAEKSLEEWLNLS